jgi:hypothetical protein
MSEIEIVMRGHKIHAYHDGKTVWINERAVRRYKLHAMCGVLEKGFYPVLDLRRSKRSHPRPDEMPGKQESAPGRETGEGRCRVVYYDFNSDGFFLIKCSPLERIL